MTNSFWRFIEGLTAKLAVLLKWDQAPISPVAESTATSSNPQGSTAQSQNLASGGLLWDTPRHAFHSVRVICDEEGLTTDEKNLICACIYQESEFYNTAKNQNKDPKGRVLSTDWGLCQVNDYYHIGPKKDFPSVDFVLQNPEKVVRWMIGMYRHGLLRQWVSYSSGAYKRWLSPVSPMWLLKL